MAHVAFADLQTLFGQNLMIALDSKGLTAENLASNNVAGLNLGLRLTNKPGKLNALWVRWEEAQ